MCKSVILLTPITEQKCTYILFFVTSRSKRPVWYSAILFLLMNCFCALHCFHHIFCVFGLLGSFWLYIWLQTPFAVQNHTNHNILSIFAQTIGYRYWAFDFRIITTSTPQNVAYARGFINREYDPIRYVRDICKRARWSGS